MKRRRFWPSLPLFAKELNEQAALARTYVLRVVFAATFFLAAFIMFYETITATWSNPFEVLGQGRKMFHSLVQLEFVAIALFMPALSCGVITREKERNTLGVLLLTKLGPRTIIIEKFLSRLVPMLSLILLSLPLMAFTYSLGGISMLEFWGSMWALVLIGTQVGALSVMWSAYCRTTVTAFLSSYLFGALALTCCVPCMPLYYAGGIDLANPAAIVGMTITAPFLTTLFLMLAEFFLVERAFLPPYNPTLEVFRKLDRLFSDMNHLTGGVVLLTENVGLPIEKPITWRETKKRSLGKVVYLFRMLVVIEVPLLLFIVISGSVATGSRYSGGMTYVLYSVWIITALLVCVKGATVFASEKSSQTLEVLLATPLSSDEVMRQKASGLRRLILVLLVPFLTIYAFEIYWDWELIPSLVGTARFGLYLAASIASYFIFAWLAAYVSIWIGLNSRTETRAILVALATVFALMLIPIFLTEAAILDSARQKEPSGPLSRFQFYSPFALVTLIEEKRLQFFALGLNIAVYAAVTATIRWLLLQNADRLLRR